MPHENLILKLLQIVSKSLETDKCIRDYAELGNFITNINHWAELLSRYSDNTNKVVGLTSKRYYVRIENNLATTILFDHID